MSIERTDGNSGDQGPMSPWGLAAASNNYSEQQPDGVEAHEDIQGGNEMQGEQRTPAPMS